MGKAVAPPELRRTAAAGDDVEHGAPACRALEAGGEAGGVHRVEESGLEGDHETEGPRRPRQQGEITQGSSVLGKDGIRPPMKPALSAAFAISARWSM